VLEPAPAVALALSVPEPVITAVSDSSADAEVAAPAVFCVTRMFAARVPAVFSAVIVAESVAAGVDPA